MEKSKNKELNPNRYWKIVIPVVIFLLISVPFPVRIGAGNIYYTIAFYGAIFLFILGMSYRLLHWYRWSRWVAALLGLSLLLSIWQIVDLSYFRIGSAYGGEFGDVDNFSNEPIPNYIGHFWFVPRFSEVPRCPAILMETYFGNEWIAIRLLAEIVGVPCGGI